jgi:hypothetical protein
MDYVAVAAFGVLVGFAELLSRYKEYTVLKDWAAGLYLGLNAAASVASLYIIKVGGFQFGSDPTSQKLWQVLVAGFSATLLLRSSLLNARAGNRDIQTGPAEILQILLAVADRHVDRRRAQKRSAVASTVMQSVDFDKAMTALPAYCFQLLQNVHEDEQKQAAEVINALKLDQSMDGRSKSLTLGLTLLTITGEDTLREAVKALGDSISTQTAAMPRSTQPRD